MDMAFRIVQAYNKGFIAVYGGLQGVIIIYWFLAVFTTSERIM